MTRRNKDSRGSPSVAKALAGEHIVSRRCSKRFIFAAPVCIGAVMLYWSRFGGHGEGHESGTNISAVGMGAVNTSTNDEMPALLYETVDRRGNLSYSEFVLEYASKRRPVVITDYSVSRLFPHMKGSMDPWKFIQRYCGSMPVQVGHRSFSKSATSAGMLFHSHVVKLSRFVRDIDSPAQAGAYVFDRSLNDVGDMEGCRALLQHFVVPRYFTGDLVKQMKLKDPATEDPFVAHPSLFVGAANSSCGLHVDAFESSFWQAVLAGRKTWHVFAIPGDQRSSLLQLDTRDPWRSRLALYEIEFEARAGDLVFIPGGTAHYVSNPDKSVSLSMNYIDASHAAEAAASMESHALFGKVSASLRATVAQGASSVTPTRGMDVAWDQFVSNH